MSIQDIYTLFQTAPVGIFFLAVIGFLLQNLPFVPYVRWLTNRRKEELAFVNTQLKEAPDLSVAMKEHLRRRRDGLLLRTTVGINVEPHLGEALMAVSEDHRHGIKWSDLEFAGRYLTLNASNEVVVNIGLWDLVQSALLVIPSVGAFLYYFVLSFAGIGILVGSVNTGSVPFVQLGQYLFLAVIFLFVGALLWLPFSRIRAACRVYQQLPKQGRHQWMSRLCWIGQGPRQWLGRLRWPVRVLRSRRRSKTG